MMEGGDMVGEEREDDLWEEGGDTRGMRVGEGT